MRCGGKRPSLSAHTTLINHCQSAKPFTRHSMSDMRRKTTIPYQSKGACKYISDGPRAISMQPFAISNISLDLLRDPVPCVRASVNSQKIGILRTTSTRQNRIFSSARKKGQICIRFRGVRLVSRPLARSVVFIVLVIHVQVPSPWGPSCEYLVNCEIQREGSFGANSRKWVR